MRHAGLDGRMISLRVEVTGNVKADIPLQKGVDRDRAELAGRARLQGPVDRQAD